MIKHLKSIHNITNNFKKNSTENDIDINNISTNNTSKNTIETKTLKFYVKKPIEYHLSYMYGKERFSINQTTTNTIREYIALKDFKIPSSKLQ